MGQSTTLEALTAELLGDVGLLHDEVKQLKETLPGAAEEIRRAGAESTDAMSAAVEKAVLDLTRGAARAELVKAAEAALNNAQKGKSTSRPLFLGAALVVGLALGGALGFMGAPNQSLTADQQHQLAAGKTFLQVLPKLDQSTRSKIKNLILENSQNQ